MDTENQVDQRREFLKFLGGTTLLALLPSGCASLLDKKNTPPSRLSLSANLEDQLRTIDGIQYSILIKERDPLNNQGLNFGTNNDFIAILPTEKPNRFLLFVNHESVHPLLSFGNSDFSREPKWIDEEMKAVGVSILMLKKDGERFQVVFDDPHNRRLDANTPIPIISEHTIGGSKTARGTLANCSGGVTPWGTVLTCEENYGDFVGDRPRGRRTIRQLSKNQYQWFTHYEMPPEHYGWVVEIDPKTGAAKKLTSLGRMAHEGATSTLAKDGRVVVYLGDDDNNRCLYKFISNSKNSLEKGILYVADLESGEWRPLDRKQNLKLKETYKDQTELLIYTREAAVIAGGTPLDRPEDIEIDPKNGNVYVCLTNNIPQNRPHGSILKIVEDNNDAGSLKFNSASFILGGEQTGFSSPDNLTIDQNGNLWMTNDVAGSKLGTETFAFSGNNSLFFIPLHGKWAGHTFRVASAPKDAEFTGPCFSPDGEKLFLSVQHPGETTLSLHSPTSHWPDGKNSLPKSAIIVLEGKTMDYFLGEEFKG